MPIIRLLSEAAFGPAEIAPMVSAHEAALELLQLNDRSDPICELIAKKIIEVARSGERDAARICARTLKELDIALPE